jgi:hypothetical protein
MPTFLLHKIHYVIHALPSNLFSLHNRKNDQKIGCKREGKQSFCKETKPTILKSPILQGKTIDGNTCVT